MFVVTKVVSVVTVVVSVVAVVVSVVVAGFVVVSVDSERDVMQSLRELCPMSLQSV